MNPTLNRLTALAFLPACGLLALAAGHAGGATITLDSQPIPGGYRLTATEEVSSCFILQTSTTLAQLTPLAMDMGAGGAVWDVPADLATTYLDTFSRHKLNSRQTT